MDHHHPPPRWMKVAAIRVAYSFKEDVTGKVISLDTSSIAALPLEACNLRTSTPSCNGSAVTPSEPLRVDRRLFRLSHAAMAGSFSMA